MDFSKFINYKIMIPYKDLDGDSGVIAYESGDDYIKVKFSSNAIYTYTNSSAGSSHIIEMKRLADLGDGLNAYIMKNVRDDYVK